MTTLQLKADGTSYNITVGRGLLAKAGELMKLDRRVLILTDNGVPTQYAAAIARAAKCSKIYTVPSGEGSKSLCVLEGVLMAMAELGMTRRDCLVAVGGGVVGDLGGFAAASYMRGIDFYNVPTTLLASVDSSVGGKTAVNLGGIKNIVGAFHQPSGVLIDTDTLATLDKRLISAGLAEAVKMAATSDADLFSRFEKYSFVDIMAHIDEIIVDSLKIKQAVVEADVHEGGIRKILNFGHTLGHGIEALSGGELYHGECVAIGMMAMCGAEVRARLQAVLEKLGLPRGYDGDLAPVLELIKHDKKSTEGGVDAIYVPEIGSFEIKNMSYGEFSAIAKAALGK